MKILFTSTLLLLGVSFLMAGNGSGSIGITPVETEEEVHSHNVSFEVEGMGCGRCAARIQNALQETDGIKESNVDFDAKEARVAFDPDKISEEKIKEVIEELDFKATPIEEDKAKSCSPGCSKDCCA